MDAIDSLFTSAAEPRSGVNASAAMAAKAISHDREAGIDDLEGRLWDVDTRPVLLRSKASSASLGRHDRSAPLVAPVLSRVATPRPNQDTMVESASHMDGEYEALAGGHSESESEWEPIREAERLRPENAERDYYSIHTYGSKAALCFSADSTKRNVPTVRLEAARSTGAAREYDWQSKIAIQFTEKELPFVLAVLLGWLPNVEFKGHGPRKDKGIAMENQDGGKVFVRVWQTGRLEAIPVFAQDLYPIVVLVQRQMLKASGFMSPEAILTTVRQLAAKYRDASAATKLQAA